MTETMRIKHPRIPLSDRVLRIMAPGHGSRRIQARLTGLYEDYLSEQRKRLAADERCFVLETANEKLHAENDGLREGLQNEKAVNLKLRKELQVAQESNKKNRHSLHVDAPVDMLEEKLAESESETTLSIPVISSDGVVRHLSALMPKPRSVSTQGG